MQRNFVLLQGYIGTDAVVRYTGTGTKVANVRLATSYHYADGKGIEQQSTTWHSLVFYGAQADAGETFVIGDNVHIEGHIQDREFTPATGSKRTVKEIIVDRCHIIAATRHGDTPEDSEALDDSGRDEHWPT